MSNLWSILACKTRQFLARSYRFGQLIVLFQKVDTLRLLKIFIIFCPPVTAKSSFFQDSVDGLNIVVQKRRLEHSSPHSNFIFWYNLYYSYFRKIKKPQVFLNFRYNQQLNYNIQNSCWNLCCDDISKSGRKNAVHIRCVKFLHGCCAWRQLH